MNPPTTAHEIEMALSGVGDLSDRVAALSQVVLDLLVEVEALRDALARTKAGGTALAVHSGYDIPCTDRELTEGKAAYPAAYVDTAFVPGRTTAMVEKVAATTPLKRVVQADEVAQAVMAAVTHLTSSTGWIIPVDGGKLVG